MATGAFNTIKSAINAGKDIQSMTTQLGQWGKAMSDLDYAHKKAEKPPMFKKPMCIALDQVLLLVFASSSAPFSVIPDWFG